jgi:hypothetical protein
MRLLREYIRELLTEAAKGPADLPDGVYVRVRDGASANFRVFYSYGSGEQIDSEATLPNGYVDVHGPSFRTSDAPCLGAWNVGGAHATHGWGPMLYDVAMEYVGDRGLMADRGGLSADAFAVWEKYMERGDVQKKQLDDEEDTLTPDIEKDNCTTDTAFQHGEFLGSDWDDYKAFYHASPVMKVYTKGPTTIEKLESIGRFIGE